MTDVTYCHNAHDDVNGEPAVATRMVGPEGEAGLPYCAPCAEAVAKTLGRHGVVSVVRPWVSRSTR